MIQGNKIEIPFGASDSEPYYQEIIIPDGLEAVMEDGKIILRRKETEDERIRKTLLESFEYQIKKSYPDKEYLCGVKLKEIVAWLKKQDKKPQGKSALEAIHEKKVDNVNKVEPRFHEGDWLCENKPNNYARFIQILEIVNVQGKERYRISRDIHNDEDTIKFDFVEKYYHKFNIKDAKDGDILVSKHNKPFIYNGKHISNRVGAHCGINFCDQFTICITKCDWTSYDVKPATKEQHDLLFSKMKKAGWEWDAEKKKLKRMQKAKWSEEDSIAIDNCCLLIAAADDSYEKSFKDDCIHYLQNLKQRMEQ